MNFIVGVIGANLTLGVISGITSATNGIYTLCSTVKSSTANGASEVKKIIRETDLEVKIKTVQYLLCEVSITPDTPCTIKLCIESIRDCIKEISDELDKIHYRMQYNDNLWMGSTVRAYKFHNCRARLEAHLKNLDSRCKTLINLLTVQDKLVKNRDLVDTSSSLLQIEDIDPQVAKRTREEIHEKIRYIKK